MNDDDLIISETQWYIYLNANKSYQGYIYHRDGKISYVLPEMTVSNNPINDVGNLSEYTPTVDTAYRVIDVTTDFYDSYPLDDSDKLKITFNTSGYFLSASGKNNVPTRTKPTGATKNTSLSSVYFRKYSIFKGKTTPQVLLRKLPNKINFGVLGKTPIRSKELGAVVGRVVPVVGRTTLFTGVAVSGYTIYNSDNKPKAIAKEAGGWAGGWAGAEGMAYLGGTIGSFFGPVYGTAIGGLIGGVVGFSVGFWGGSTITELTYESLEN